jgi:hypothetical protein
MSDYLPVFGMPGRMRRDPESLLLACVVEVTQAIPLRNFVKGELRDDISIACTCLTILGIRQCGALGFGGIYVGFLVHYSLSLSRQFPVLEVLLDCSVLSNTRLNSILGVSLQDCFSKCLLEQVSMSKFTRLCVREQMFHLPSQRAA